MRREVRQISRLTPLQRDTAIVVPNSFIKGGATIKTDVVGSALSKAITVERLNDLIPVLDTSLRFLVTATGKFKVTNVDTGYVTGEKDASSADVVITDFSGIKITVKTGLSSAVADDICDVSVVGDSTYIVPGTILGRINDSSDYKGKWEPVGSDLTKYDIFRVCGGTIETNKQNYVAPISNTMNNADNYTVDVYVFAQVIESVCRSINLTDDIKAKIQGIVWE